MEAEKITEQLKTNVEEYHKNRDKLETLEERQEELKKENLGMMKMLGMKKGDDIVFGDIDLRIQLIEMRKKIRVNEVGIVERFGKDLIEGMKVLPVAAIEAAIKTGKLPMEADEYIERGDPIEYTKISAVVEIITAE